MAAVDIALLGATGFTGGLAADHLGAHLPDDARWAIAGRNREKLLGVARRIEGAGGLAPQIIEADVTDDASLAALAAQTRVLVTAVGPYLEHGLPVARAAAEAGIAYLDLCGEAAFVDQVWLELHELARTSGARLVHAAGFDSVPTDLGVLFTVDRLPSDVPLTVRAFLRIAIVPSAGTLHSAVDMVADLRGTKRIAAERRAREVRSVGRKATGGGRLRRAPHAKGWAVPAPLIEPQIVLRSARALAQYGPDFRYEHYLHVRSTVALAAGGLAAALGGAAVQLKHVRSLIRSVVKPGVGPSEKFRSRSWFTLDLLGEGGGSEVHVRVSGDDPGYGGAAAILAQSAMCLAFDDVPDVAGQVTTAQAMGQALIDRLAGPILRFEVR
jgi:saccharopine dehydrogenase (NAD+, L-glutamate forming)